MGNRYSLFVCVLAIVILAGCVQNSQKPIITTTTTTIPFLYKLLSYPESKSIDINFTLLYKTPIAKSPLLVFIDMESSKGLNELKINRSLEGIKYSFEIWKNVTNGLVVFEPVTSNETADVIIKFAQNLKGDEIGYASPVASIFDTYTLITGGSVVIEPRYSEAEGRNLIAHEFGHLLGLGHSKNPHSIMYSYNIYSQEITDDIKEAMRKIYSYKLPDLRIENAVLFGNLTVKISNAGPMDSPETILALANDTGVFYQTKISAVRSLTRVEYTLRIPPVTAEKIQLILDYTNMTKEMDEENNMAGLVKFNED